MVLIFQFSLALFCISIFSLVTVKKTKRPVIRRLVFSEKNGGLLFKIPPLEQTQQNHKQTEQKCVQLI